MIFNLFKKIRSHHSYPEPIKLSHELDIFSKDSNECVTIPLRKNPMRVGIFQNGVLVIYESHGHYIRISECYNFQGELVWSSPNLRQNTYNDMFYEEGNWYFFFYKKVFCLEPNTGKILNVSKQEKTINPSTTRIISTNDNAQVKIRNTLEVRDSLNNIHQLVFQDPVKEVVHLGDMTFVRVDLADDQECSNLFFYKWPEKKETRIVAPENSKGKKTPWVFSRIGDKENIIARTKEMYVEFDNKSGDVILTRPLTKDESMNQYVI